ncbi:uncharacterized protein [Centruroides vittatus]|uniref:uncharacterized protein n=1 Tax=Centruroides vittatus TaxID=120091 RepID=UPI00350F62CC
MNEILEYLVLGLIVLLTFICLVCCFLVSCLAFSMEITFQEIRQFSACSMPVESKLKILNFMKRFGKVALKISMMGYFYVNKRFPIRMAKSLLSVYSGLLKLRDFSHHSKICNEMSIRNYTEI